MRLYRLLLLLYPRDFRERFGPEMERDFDALRARYRRLGGRRGIAGLWLRTTADVLASGIRERAARLFARDGGDGPMGRAFFHLGQALRSLRRAPGYAAAFILTLGLAIGVNSAVFSVVDGVLLEPLPFEDADRILYLKQPVTRAGVENADFSFIEIDDYRERVDAVGEFVEFGDWDFSVVGDGEPHRAVGGLVTSNFFDVLGIRPALGRVLGPQDDRPGAEPVVVLTDDYWTRAFGADPGVVGRLVSLTGTRTRIVGVLEPGLHYTGSRRPDFYVNYATNDHYQGAAMRDSRTHRMTEVFARVAPGHDVETARREVERAAAGMHAEYPEAYPPELGYGVEAVLWSVELTRQARPTFLLLMATVGLILLLACANVANLTLTRLIRKEEELATREALGATGVSLRLHLTAENVVLGLAGAVLGLLLAVASRGALVSYASRFTVRAQEVGVDLTVLVSTLGAAVAVAVLLAWLPGLPVAPGTRAVASAASKATHGRWRRRVQRGLVVGQLALSFSLLAGAGLLVRSLLELGSVEPGFRTEDVLTLEAPGGNFASQQDDAELFRQALREIRAYPGVRAAAVASWVPLDARSPIAFHVRVEGVGDGGDRSHRMAFNNVTPGYFEAVGMRLLEGRFLGRDDGGAGDAVLVINESMADAHFPDADPIGQRLSFSFDGEGWTPPYRVVGVVADAREHGIGRAGVHTAYRHADQAFWGPSVVVATEGDPYVLAQHVKGVVHALDPGRPVDRIRTLEEMRDADLAPSRLNATLFGAFAVLALLIAGVGVLGVLAFSVSQRVREFGVRMALGADRSRVLGSVLLEGSALILGALAVGGVVAVLVGRSLSGLLFQVDPVDPVSLGLSALLLGGIAMVAALVPALRATRVDPAEALRAE